MKTILRITAILSLLAGVCLGQGTAPGLTVQIQNAGTPVITAKKYLILNCVSGLNCAYSNGVLGITVTGGSPTWDAIVSPVGNQTLTMTGDSTTWNWGTTNTNKFAFDTSGNPTFGLVNSTTAVTSSPTLTLGASYQNAGTPTFAADTWGIRDVVGAGTNGISWLTFTHTGTTGNHGLNIPDLNGSGAATLTLGTATNGTGIGTDGSNNLILWSGGSFPFTATGSSGASLGSGGALGFTSGLSNGTRDTAFSRGAAGLIDIGTGTAASTAGFLKTAHTVALSADWTCGTGGTVSSCVAATIVGSTATPLTFTLPLVAANWSFECDLVVGQATAATANQWNILTATNGVTSTTASYQMATAATAFAAGAVTDQASTTTTFQITPSWTLGGTATKMPVHIAGTLTGVSASGTVFSLQLVAPTVGDLVTIYEGSKCSLNP